MKAFWRALFFIHLVAIVVLGAAAFGLRNSMGVAPFLFGLWLLGAPWSIAALFFSSGATTDVVIHTITIGSLLLNGWLLWRAGFRYPSEQTAANVSAPGENQRYSEVRRILGVVIVPFAVILFLWWVLQSISESGGMYRGPFLAQIATLTNSWLFFARKPRFALVALSTSGSVLLALGIESVIQRYGFPPVFDIWLWLFLLCAIYGVGFYVRRSERQVEANEV